MYEDDIQAVELTAIRQKLGARVIPRASPVSRNVQMAAAETLTPIQTEDVELRPRQRPPSTDSDEIQHHELAAYDFAA